MIARFVALPRGGGDMQTLGSARGTLHVRDGQLFFIDGAQQSVRSMPLGGIAPDIVADGFSRVTDFDLDDDDVYVAADQTVFAVTRTTSATTTTLATTLGDGFVSVFGASLRKKCK